ncbi:MAG TPA: hypothetical protein VGN17_26190 [Bryobacteraceae bacterium]|jgi:hypothetical protein
MQTKTAAGGAMLVETTAIDDAVCVPVFNDGLTHEVHRQIIAVLEVFLSRFKTFSMDELPENQSVAEFSAQRILASMIATLTTLLPIASVTMSRANTELAADSDSESDICFEGNYRNVRPAFSGDFIEYSSCLTEGCSHETEDAGFIFEIHRGGKEAPLVSLDLVADADQALLDRIVISGPDDWDQDGNPCEAVSQ